MNKNDSLPSKSAQEVVPTGIPQFQRITTPKKRAWLVAYAQTGTITGTSKLSAMDWRNHDHWLNKDKDYKLAIDIAKQIAGDSIEDSIIDAAMAGNDVPVIYEGKITQHYRRKSDVLRMFVLKGGKPEYRDSFNVAAVTGPVSLSITYPSTPVKVIDSGTMEK